MSSIFTTLLIKILPLYLLIAVGYIAGKYLKVQKESLAPLLIYIITPMVVLGTITATHLSGTFISLPFLYFIPAVLMCLLFYYIAGFWYKDSHRNILAYASGTANTGYFALPLVLVLFGPTYFNVALFISLGGILYESTVGFFIVARGSFTYKQSLYKILKLPTIYAIIVGVVVNINNVSIGQSVIDFFNYFKGAYIILGMMLIGVSLSQVVKTSLDKAFTTLAFVAKFIVLPLIAVSMVLLDKYMFHIYTVNVHTVLLIMSAVPIASNTVVLATLFKTQPEKMVVTVLLSTVVGLIYVPVFVLVVLMGV